MTGAIMEAVTVTVALACIKGQRDSMTFTSVIIFRMSITFVARFKRRVIKILIIAGRKRFLVSATSVPSRCAI